MKSIQLTEKHKSKLLEMCKELFCEESEINSIQNFRVENDYILGLSDHILYCENRDLSENHYECEKVPEEDLVTFENYPIECFEINIHWFEFCMTHLVEKLNDLSDVYEEIPPYVANVYGGANGKWNLYVKFHFHYPKNRYKKHPVDYLYEEFKKIKL